MMPAMGAAAPARRIGFALLLLLLITLTSAAAQPGDGTPLFSGITYYREDRTDPRPYTVHIVTVDLTAPGIGFAVTPGDPDAFYQLEAQTTSAFLAAQGVQVAINANYFTKEDTGSLLDALYLAGQPVRALGLAVADGAAYAVDAPGLAFLAIGADNDARIDSLPPGVRHAVAGRYVILRAGAIQPVRSGVDARTAVGLDASGQTLILAVVDGRRAASEGATYTELAALLLEYGAWTAINLDGGGSATLVIEGSDGRPLVVNRPFGNRVIGGERPVAVHLGIFAQPLP
jgi:hypothetical protein